MSNDFDSHYKTLYKIVKYEKDSIEKELEEYKLLCSVQQDIINNQNKKISRLSKMAIYEGREIK